MSPKTRVLKEKSGSYGPKTVPLVRDIVGEPISVPSGVTRTMGGGTLRAAHVLSQSSGHPEKCPTETRSGMDRRLEEVRTCKHCGAEDLRVRLVHYATRCYSHPACLYLHGGEAAIAKLHAHQIRHLPVLPLVKAGLPVEHLSRLLLQAEEREASHG